MWHIACAAQRKLCATALAAVLAAPIFADAPPLPSPLVDGDFLYDGAPDQGLVELGRQLFFDPVLSGNRNIACGTCHDPARGTGDGLALGIGEGGAGLGAARHSAQPVTGRVPRNAQPLYNIGARAYTALFHDGRVELDPAQPAGMRSPALARLPQGLDNILAVQAMFPVLSPVEMAGQRGENPVADAVAAYEWEAAWDHLARRLAEIPGYAQAFLGVFNDLEDPDQITFVHAANALAAFQSVAFRSDQSPFDAVLATGDAGHLPEAAQRGLDLFYGAAGCSGCHGGALLTDHAFHAIAMPQIGPGKNHGSDLSYWEASDFRARVEDEGRYNVTWDPADLFAFRTPSLRNVALTGPWGHAGGFDSLSGVIRHHADSVASLHAFRPEAVALPPLDRLIEARGRNFTLRFQPVPPARRHGFDLRDSFVQRSKALRARIAAANELAPVRLDEADIAALVAFLDTLTDPTARDRSHLIPAAVPSGLPVQPAPITPDPNHP